MLFVNLHSPFPPPPSQRLIGSSQDDKGYDGQEVWACMACRSGGRIWLWDHPRCEEPAVHVLWRKYSYLCVEVCINVMYDADMHACTYNWNKLRYTRCQVTVLLRWWNLMALIVKQCNIKAPQMLFFQQKQISCINCNWQGCPLNYILLLDWAPIAVCLCSY